MLGLEDGHFVQHDDAVFTHGQWDTMGGTFYILVLTHMENKYTLRISVL